jgi:DNA methylase
MINLLDVFDEVKRVLKKTGNCFIVLGDSYIEKDLQLIPSRFAFMMKNNGWILRDYVIWEKPNPLPSSADDRFTLNWEHVFHFVKSPKYFFETQYNVRPDGFFGSIMRSVWRIPVSGTKEKHFAVYPLKLIEPMIRAGCPSRICSSCGFMSKYIYISSTINTRIGKNYGQSGSKTGSEDDPHRRTHQRDFSRYRQTPIKKLYPIGSTKYSENDISRLYSGNEWIPNVKWLKECAA